MPPDPPIPTIRRRGAEGCVFIGIFLLVGLGVWVNVRRIDGRCRRSGLGFLGCGYPFSCLVISCVIRFVARFADRGDKALCAAAETCVVGGSAPLEPSTNESPNGRWGSGYSEFRAELLGHTFKGGTRAQRLDDPLEMRLASRPPGASLMVAFTLHGSLFPAVLRWWHEVLPVITGRFDDRLTLVCIPPVSGAGESSDIAI